MDNFESLVKASENSFAIASIYKRGYYEPAQRGFMDCAGGMDCAPFKVLLRNGTPFVVQHFPNTFNAPKSRSGGKPL